MSPRPWSALPAPVSALLAAILLLTGSLLAGCTSGDDSPSEAEPTAESTPLAEWEPTSVVITRTDFCDFVPDQAVEAAVGTVSETDHYGNGSEIEVGDDTDLAHEYGCAWTGDRGTARAWVFAPQITEARAEVLLKEQREAKGCRTVEGDFGDPSLGQVCESGEASYRGLFVDSWLTCTLERSGAKEKRLVELTGEWCVAAAKAAGTTS